MSITVDRYEKNRFLLFTLPSKSILTNFVYTYNILFYITYVFRTFLLTLNCSSPSYTYTLHIKLQKF